MTPVLLYQMPAAAQMIEDINLVAAAVQHGHGRRHRHATTAQPSKPRTVVAQNDITQIGIPATREAHAPSRSGCPKNTTREQGRSTAADGLLNHDDPSAVLRRIPGRGHSRHARAEYQ